MLEELGLGEAPSAERGRRRRLQHLHDPREARHEARRLSRRGGGAEARDPDRVIAVGGCYAEAQRERIFELYPDVDVAFGPGSIAHLGEWLGAGGVGVARGRFGLDERAFAADAADAPRARASRPGCRSRWAATRSCSYCIVPAVRGREQSRRPGEIVAEVDAARARRRPRDHAARPERQLVGPRSRARDPRPSSASSCAPATRSTGSSASASRARTRRTSASP